MKSQTLKSVWEAIENTPEEAENMKLRSALMRDLQRHIAARGWKQAEAAEVEAAITAKLTPLRPLSGKRSAPECG